MWIYLLRHGVAEDAAPGESDELRALTAEGRELLERAAPTWTALAPTPAVVVTSPLLRARQTCEVFCEAFDYEGEVRVDEALVPNARTAQALNLLECELLTQTQSVALVGHEPQLGYLLGALLTGSEHAHMRLKKGMLVGLQCSSSTNVVCDLRFCLGQKRAGRLA